VASCSSCPALSSNGNQPVGRAWRKDSQSSYLNVQSIHGSDMDLSPEGGRQLGLCCLGIDTEEKNGISAL